MPSPFPGMDPYLEDPGLWPDVHHGLISEIQAVLNAQLRPKYHVRVEERVYISDENDPGRAVIIPDLRIADRPGTEATSFQPSGVATLEVAEPVEVTTLIDDEIHEARLEVVDRGLRQVVTVIEVVSPTNKIHGSRGRDSYLKKRQEVMRSPSHWAEIDLLRAGVPLRVREPSERPRPASRTASSTLARTITIFTPSTPRPARKNGSSPPRTKFGATRPLPMTQFISVRSIITSTR